MKSDESKEEKVDLEKEEKLNEEPVNAKRDKKSLASVWELLMHSRVHREALVMALDHKKIHKTCTPNQMVDSLIETPQGAIVFTEDDLPLEDRDHSKALFIKADMKEKLT